MSKDNIAEKFVEGLEQEYECIKGIDIEEPEHGLRIRVHTDLDSQTDLGSKASELHSKLRDRLDRLESGDDKTRFIRIDW